jgi:hypothetical protein
MPFQSSLILVGLGLEPTIEWNPCKKEAFALPMLITLSWKGLPGPNTLAYIKNSLITDLRSFITFGLWLHLCKLS